MHQQRAATLGKQDAVRWFAGVMLGGCAVNLSDGIAAVRRLPESMAPLWHVAYSNEASARDNGVPSLPTTGSLADRMLVHACFGLAAVCPEVELRAAVDELADTKASADLSEAILRSIAIVRARLDEIVGTSG